MPRDIPSYEAPPREDESELGSADASPDAEVVEEYQETQRQESSDGPRDEEAADDDEVPDEDPEESEDAGARDDEEAETDDDDTERDAQRRQDAAGTAGRETVKRTVDDTSVEESADTEEDDEADTGNDTRPATNEEPEEHPEDDDKSADHDEDEPLDAAEEDTGDAAEDLGEEDAEDHEDEDDTDDTVGKEEAVDDVAEDTEGGDDTNRAEGEDHDEDADTDLDQWDKEIAEHEREARANGRGDPPPRDLEELEDLLDAMDPDSGMTASQRQPDEGDDWERSRDASGATHTEDGPDNKVASPEPQSIPVEGPVKLIDTDSQRHGADVVQMDEWARTRAGESDDDQADAAHANGGDGRSNGNGSDGTAEVVDADEVIRGIRSVEEFMREEFDGREYPPDVVARADEYEARGDYEGAYGVLLEYEQTRGAAPPPEQPGAPLSEQTPGGHRPDEDNPQPALF